MQPSAPPSRQREVCLYFPLPKNWDGSSRVPCGGASAPHAISKRSQPLLGWRARSWTLGLGLRSHDAVHLSAGLHRPLPGRSTSSGRATTMLWGTWPSDVRVRTWIHHHQRRRIWSTRRRRGSAPRRWAPPESSRVTQQLLVLLPIAAGDQHFVVVGRVGDRAQDSRFAIQAPGPDPGQDCCHLGC